MIALTLAAAWYGMREACAHNNAPWTAYLGGCDCRSQYAAEAARAAR